jgi:hypothetical protein
MPDFENNNKQSGETTLWNSLTVEQQIQVLEAYEESEDESTLIPLSTIRSKYFT